MKGIHFVFWVKKTDKCKSGIILFKETKAKVCDWSLITLTMVVILMWVNMINQPKALENDHLKSNYIVLFVNQIGLMYRMSEYTVTPA